MAEISSLEPIKLPDETHIRQRLVILATEMNGLRSLLRVVRRHKSLTSQPHDDSQKLLEDRSEAEGNHVE